MNLNEQRIREFAYQIWESEGRPVGQSERHWEMATKLAAGQEEQANGDTDVPANEPVEPISPGSPQTQPVSDPIQPGEPPQQPAQPVASAEQTEAISAQPTAVTPPRKSRAKAAADAPARSLIDTKPVEVPLGKSGTPAAKKSTPKSKPKKSQITENA